MADRIELAFRRAILEDLAPEARVAVAVSGGGDSVALLHLMAGLYRGGLEGLAVLHLDHGLRRGSRADRGFVERLCAELGLTCIAERREVAELRTRRESPEEAARRVRRGFLLEAAERWAADWIVTGHTLDDQAETVLMRLVRGAGPTALCGIAGRGPGPFLRPLLAVERNDLRRWLDRRGLPYRDDPSNRDLRFDRNRVRRLVLPFLADALNPRAARNLVRAAERLREDALCLDRLGENAFDRLVAVRGRGVGIDAVGLASTPPALARRVAREALRRAGADPRRLTATHLEGLVDLAAGGRGRSLHLPGRLRARRTGTRLLIEPDA